MRFNLTELAPLGLSRTMVISGGSASASGDAGRSWPVTNSCVDAKPGSTLGGIAADQGWQNVNVDTDGNGTIDYTGLPNVAGAPGLIYNLGPRGLDGQPLGAPQISRVCP